jgi:hypothetical protein
MVEMAVVVKMVMAVMVGRELKPVVVQLTLTVMARRPLVKEAMGATRKMVMGVAAAQEL